MKTILIVIIGVLLWQSTDAREFTSHMLYNASEIVKDLKLLFFVSFSNTFVMSKTELFDLLMACDSGREIELILDAISELY